MKFKVLSIAVGVLASATATPVSAATVAYWQLDEASGALVDVVGGNDFPAGSGQSYAQAALVDPVSNPDATAGPANSGAIDFSGTSDAPRLTGAANDPFEVLDTRSFTFEGWIQHNITNGTQSGIEQFAGDRHGSAYTGWAMWINGGLPQIYFDMGSPRVYVQATTRIDDGTPHHVAAVWDHVNLQFRLYVDGVEEGAMTGDVADLSNSSNYDKSDDPFALGARRTSGGYNASALNGKLDELRFSDVALSPSEFLNAPPDTALPEIASLSPTNGATGVLPGRDLVATFNESIALTGAGMITVTNLDTGSNLSIDLASPADPDGSVSVAGDVLTIDLAASLDSSANYAVRISTNAIRDLAAATNLFAGITNDTTWSFSTAAPDFTAPTITALSPTNNATAVARDADLVATFTEIIETNATGSILITNLTDGSSTTIAIGDSSQVTVSGANLTIAPLGGLEGGDSYAVLIATNALKDLSGNLFAGITNATTWTFNTIPNTVAYWEHGSSSSLIDVAGGDHTLTGGNGLGASTTVLAPTPVPNPDPATTGSPGSIYFNGSHTGPRTTSAAPFKLTTTNSWTFEGWLKTTQTSTGVIAGDRHNSNGYTGWYFLIGSTGTLQFYFTTGTASSITSSTAVNDDIPHHFAVVWDHAAGLMRLYLDGYPEGTATPTVASYTQSAGFGIGARARGADNVYDDDRFEGRLDELRFSRLALAPSEFLLGPDTSSPATTVLSPTNNAVEVPHETDLVATFDERIMLTGTGMITVTNLDNGSALSIDLSGLPDPAAAVSVSARDLTIDPTADLDADSNYAVLISAGAIADLAATNLFGGITNHTTWRFTTAPPDTTPPGIIAQSPTNGAASVLPGVTLVATFDEPISIKSGGTITITDLTDGSSTRMIALTNALVSSPNGDDLAIELTLALDLGNQYSVRISPDAVEDQATIPNAFAGITNDTTWTFTTVARPEIGTIAVMDTGSYSHPYSGLPAGYRFVVTPEELDGFNPGGADKLVLALSWEDPASFDEVSYGGVALTQIVKEVSSLRNVAIFYLDGPPSAGDLVVDLSNANGVGLTAIALLNTQPDYVSPPVAAEATSTSLTTTEDGSLVLAAAVNNNGPFTDAQPPLTPLFSVDAGSAGHGSGYQQVAESGTTITPTFASPDAEAVVAVEFLAVQLPAPTVLIVR